MKVAASASARPRHSGLAVFAGNGPTLAIVGRGREGGVLGRAYGMSDEFFEQLRDEKIKDEV